MSISESNLFTLCPWDVETSYLAYRTGTIYGSDSDRKSCLYPYHVILSFPYHVINGTKGLNGVYLLFCRLQYL